MFTEEGIPPVVRPPSTKPLVGSLDEVGVQKTPTGVADPTLPKYFSRPSAEQVPEAEAEAEAEVVQGEERPPGEQEGRDRGKQRVGGSVVEDPQSFHIKDTLGPGSRGIEAAMESHYKSPFEELFPHAQELIHLVPLEGTKPPEGSLLML